MYIFMYIAVVETTNTSDLRRHLKIKLDAVSFDKTTIIIHRANADDVVMLSLSEYNSWKETNYLNSTKANRDNLEASIKEAKEGKLTAIKTADLWK